MGFVCSPVCVGLLLMLRNDPVNFPLLYLSHCSSEESSISSDKLAHLKCSFSTAVLRGLVK
jgi:hypothetical protein